MDGRRRRGSEKHRGVVLKKRTLPSGEIAWRARYRDPDTGKEKYETLPSSLTTAEARFNWAKDKAELLKEREKELARGAPTKTNLSLSEVVKRYFQDVSTRLRAKTLKAYKDATDALIVWADGAGVRLADDLTPPRLAALRSWLVNKPLQRQAKGARKHRAHEPTSKVRSPYTVNRDLSSLKTVLEHLRSQGLVPMLHTRDAIRDSLKDLPQPKPVPEFLRPELLVELVLAAQRHDDAKFELTRKEKKQGLTVGVTPRHDPILPYLAFVLLSGMRADEARMLRWDAVDLKAHPAGVVTLRPEDVKTKHGRIVDLIVSPLLHELLTTLKLKAGDAKYVFTAPEDDEEEEESHKTPEGEERPISRSWVEAARKRLVRTYRAPAFSWQQLRVTCGTFLANAPGIFGAAAVFREAKQLGHSVAVAEKHYLGVVHVDRDEKTLETAMGVDAALRRALGLAVAAPAEMRPRKKARHA